MSGRALFIASAKAGPELKAGTADCKKIYDVLLNPLYGGINPQLSPPILLDCDSDSNFIHSINDFFKASAAADQRIVYFTGHGRVSDGRYCLIFGGIDALPFSSITALLDGKGPGKTLFILDTCHSGAAELGGIKSDSSLPIPATASCILASSRDIQLSHEDEQFGSLFTHYLCDCITTGNDGQATTDGLITVPDAVAYIQKKLASKSNSQTPRYSIKNAEGLVWIAKNISGSASSAAHSVDPASSPDKQRRPCAGATVEDLDQDLVRTYAEKYLKDASGAFAIIVRQLDLFYNSSDERPNEAAILCFGVRPERFFPDAASAFSAGDRASEMFERRVVEGPLVRQLEELLQLTMNNLREAATFGASALRTDRPEIPREVIREVLSNALAHRNFDSSGRVHVHVADDHLEISNPGSFPESHSWEELLDHPGLSLTPNRRVANHLQRIGGYEGVGRGFSILKRYRDLRGEDAISFRQAGGTVICLLKRHRPWSEAPATPASSSMELRLTEYLSAQSEALAQKSNLLSQTTDRLVGPPLVAPTGQSTTYRSLLDELEEPGRQLLLTGAAGSGKSFILRHCASEFAKRFIATVKAGPASSALAVPIFISLRQFRTDTPKLSAIAFSLGVEATLVEHVFAAHRAVLFCDGLDEVDSSNRARIVTSLAALRADFPKTSMVVSSRPSDDVDQLIGFEAEFAVSGLSDSDVQVVLAQLDEKAAREIDNYLKKTNSDLFKNPLLLSLLLRIFDSVGTLPENEDLLFEFAVDTLLFRHDATKGAFIRHNQSSLDLSEMKRILGAIGFIMLRPEMQQSFSRNEFSEVVRRAFNLTQIRGPNETFLETRNVIEDLVVSGLLVESEIGIGFLHRSVAEYFAARGVVQLSPSLELFVSILRTVIPSSSPELAIKMVRGWAQSPEQGDALLRTLRSLQSNSDPETRAVFASLIDAATVKVERLQARNKDIARILGDKSS